MKRHLWIIFGVTLAALSLLGCRQAESPDRKTPTRDALADGAAKADGAVTASLVDGASITGADGLPYVAAGPGHFEVKSNAGWQNITATTASVVTWGQDKGLKLELDLTGGSTDAPKQYEVTYAFDTAPGLKSSVWTSKIYIPEVYATPGLTAYPSLSLYVKTGNGWTGIKIVEMSTFALGSGWKTLTLDFAQSTFLVDGTALSGVSADFGQVAATFGLCPGVTVSFYAEALDPAMKGAFYLDYLNVSGVALAQVAKPEISVANNLVTIADATADAVIHYTTNGTTPTAESPVYTAPVAITATTTFQAIALKEGMAPSDVASFEAVYLVGDLTVDTDVTFAFASTIAAASADDWGTPYGTLAWAKESPDGSDGVLVLQGEATAPTSAKKSVLTLNLAAPMPNLTSVALRIRVPASMAADWYQALTVIAREGDAWASNNSSEIKFPAESFAADTWKTISLTASQFDHAPADVRALTLQVYRNFAADTSQATSLGDIEIDWVSVQ